MPKRLSPSFLAREDQEMEQQKACGRADQHGADLGYVASDQRREVRVGDEPARYQPKHQAAYHYAQRRLYAERSYLLHVVAGVVSEGPERIPQVAVRIRQGQGQEVEQHEYLWAAGGVDQQQQVQDPE